MASIVRNVRDFPPRERRWLESALGHSLQEDQQVFIVVLTPGVAPDEEARRQALTQMEQSFDEAQKHALEHGVSERDIDEAVDEATARIRYGKS